jgi:HAD superfamily hydrolase (TIGR01549 family)
MESLLTKEVILWDFDGVILNSLAVREFGFIKTLSNYPKDKVDLLLKFHHDNGGLSRYVKFEYFFNEILKIKVQDEVLKELQIKFSAIMRKSLSDKKLLIADVNTFILKNSNNFKMHIVSGSDQEELRYLCRELKISDYFLSIFGSPTPKKELVNTLLNNNKYDRSKTCLIGDSINDYEAAKHNNIYFLAYNNPEIEYLSEIKPFF